MQGASALQTSPESSSTFLAGTFVLKGKKMSFKFYTNESRLVLDGEGPFGTLRRTVHGPGETRATLNELALKLGNDKPVLEKPSLTPPGIAWKERTFKVAEASLNGAATESLARGLTFLAPSTDRILQSFADTSSLWHGLTFKRVNEGGYKYALTTRGGETWYVTEENWYSDQFPRGRDLESKVLVLTKKGGEGAVFAECEAKELVKPNGIDFAFAAAKIAQAKRDDQNEKRDPAKHSGFDIGTAPVGFIGLVDGSDDLLARAVRDDVKYFPQMMNSLKSNSGKPRYDFRSVQGSEQLLVDREPAKMINDVVGRLHALGIRKFRLHLIAHGSTDGVIFHYNGGEYKLRGADMLSLFNKFQDSDFLVDSVACKGGNFAAALRDYNDPSGRDGRVIVRLHGKPDGVGYEGRVTSRGNGVPAIFSNYYTIFHSYFVQKGFADGDAHLKADREVQKLVPGDPEVWRSGPKGGTNTAVLRPHDSGKRLPL
jgi:hypothetical protein